MSEAEVDRLSRLEAVDTEEAERALNEADGDFDQARILLRDAPASIKFRFASQEEEIYGLGCIQFDVSPPGFKEMDVAVANDQDLKSVNLNQDQEKLCRVINQKSSEPSSMAALTQRLEEGIKESFSPPSDEWVSLLQARNEADIQFKLEEFVKDQLGEGGLVLSVQLQVGLEGSPESTDNQEENEETETDSPTSKRTDDENHVTLISDLKVSPVKGTVVKDLVPGDLIYVDVDKLKNPQDKTLIDVMDNLRDDRVDMIPAPIKSLENTETGKVEITVQFGENVFGRTVAGEEMNILTPASLSGFGSNVSSLLSILPWVLIGLGVLTFGIVILYMFVFSM